MQRQRVLRVALAVALLGLLILGVWWVLHEGRAVDGPAAAHAAAAAGQVAGASGAHLGPGLKESARPASAAPPAPGLVLANEGSDVATQGERVWDLCGVGRMPVPPQTPASASAERAIESLPIHLGSDALAQAHTAIWSALDAGPPRWQAAAMVLRGTDAAGRPVDQALRALSLAVADPVIDQWALRSCGEVRSCAEAHALRWALHDGDNLAAWAAVLRHSPPQRHDEVLARLAQATRFTFHETALTAAVLQAMPDSVPAYLQVPLWIHLIGIEVSMPFILPPIAAICRDPLMPGSTAHTRCAAMARVMAEHSDTMLGTAMGLNLAGRTYLSQAESKRQRDALTAVPRPLDEMFDLQQPLSCEGVRRLGNYIQLRIQVGEVGAWRALAAAHASSATAR